MSTLSILKRINEQKEEALHNSINERLAARDRIMPGERLMEFTVTIEDRVFERAVYFFPDHERK